MITQQQISHGISMSRIYVIRKFFVELECHLHQHCVETTQPFPPNPAEELPEISTEYHTFVTIQSGTQPPAKPLVT